MIKEINRIRILLKDISPQIHCITNPISINQCANTILSLGAKPIMAEHPKEVMEITLKSGALVLNLGNITDARMKSMLISAKAASRNNIPIIIDLVGVGCSELRRKFVLRLLNKVSVAAVKGNYSEINAIYNLSYKTKGVDTEFNDINYMTQTSANLAKKYGFMVAASGKCDIVTDGYKTYYVKNGIPALGNITGTGCMLGVICGCYLSVRNNIDALLTSCVVMGICGELADEKNNIGDFSVNLMNKLYSLTDEEIEKYMKAEEEKVNEKA